MTTTDPLELINGGIVQEPARQIGTALTLAAGLDPKLTLTDVNRVDATHVELLEAQTDMAGNIIWEDDHVVTTTHIIELPPEHPWIWEPPALAEANEVVRAAAEYLEATQAGVILGGDRVMTSHELLIVIEHALKILGGAV